jgi:hypothetical protein
MFVGLWQGPTGNLGKNEQKFLRRINQNIKTLTSPTKTTPVLNHLIRSLVRAIMTYVPNNKALMSIRSSASKNDVTNMD